MSFWTVGEWSIFLLKGEGRSINVGLRLRRLEILKCQYNNNVVFEGVMVICGLTCAICARQAHGLRPDAEGEGPQTMGMEGANYTGQSANQHNTRKRNIITIITAFTHVMLLCCLWCNQVDSRLYSICWHPHWADVGFVYYTARPYWLASSWSWPSTSAIRSKFPYLILQLPSSYQIHTVNPCRLFVVRLLWKLILDRSQCVAIGVPLDQFTQCQLVLKHGPSSRQCIVTFILFRTLGWI